jgi:hypothetical protein
MTALEDYSPCCWYNVGIMHPFALSKTRLFGTELTKYKSKIYGLMIIQYSDWSLSYAEAAMYRSSICTTAEGATVTMAISKRL